MDIPFERRIPSDSTHIKLAESLLNVDHQSNAELSGIACNFWLRKCGLKFLPLILTSKGGEMEVGVS